MKTEDALRRYAEFFERLTPDSLDDLDARVTETVTFRDPFNETEGRDALRRIFEHMYETLEAPHFTVLDMAASGDAGYLKWRFDGRLRGRAFSIEGMSEVRFADDGRVSAHIDHWDAASQVYARIPILGGMLRGLRRRFAAG